MKIVSFSRSEGYQVLGLASQEKRPDGISLTIELASDGTLDFDSLKYALDALGVRATKQGEATLVQPQPAEATKSRRSRGTADDSPATTEASPTTGRRSRRSTPVTSSETAPAEPSASTAEPSPSSEPAPASRRRRQQPEAPAGISDADLTKAASEGARVLGPEFVTDWLLQFGVAEVSKLTQDVRREFIDGISDEIEKKAA